MDLDTFHIGDTQVALDRSISVQVRQESQFGTAMRKRAEYSPYSEFEQRWFAAVLIYTAAPLALVLVRAPRSVDFWWDLAMAGGGIAASGLALLPLLSARWWVAEQPATGFLRLVQTVHRELSYVALALILAHVGILVTIEGRVIEYLKLGANAEMLAGLIATVLLTALIVSSRYREPFRFSYRGWRQWHIALSIGAIALVAWHLVGSGYYFAASQWAGLIWLMGVPTALTLILRHWPRARGRISGWVLLAPSHGRRVVLAVSLVWIATSIGLAWWGTTQAPLEKRTQCAIDPCL